MYTELSLDDIERINDAYPCRLIVLLYDEAVASLRTAVEAIEQGEIETRCNATSRVVDMVSQLYTSLDLEQGGAIAENLARIYELVIVQMPYVNLNNDTALAKQMIELLMPLRDAWSELDERIRGYIALAEKEDNERMAATMIASKSMEASATL